MCSKILLCYVFLCTKWNGNSWKMFGKSVCWFFLTYDDVVRTIFQCKIFTKVFSYDHQVAIATISSLYIFCRFSLFFYFVLLLLHYETFFFFSYGSGGGYHLQIAIQIKVWISFPFFPQIWSVLFRRLDASIFSLVVVGRWVGIAFIAIAFKWWIKKFH